MIRRPALAAAVLAFAAAAAAADEVTPQSGDVLKGKVVERTEVRVVLDHPTLGKITLPGEKVKSVRLEGEPPPPPPAPPKEEPRLVNKLEVGLNGSEGNTESFGFIAGLGSDYRTEGHVWRFESRFFYKEVDGDATDNRFHALLRKDWTFEKDSRYSFFAEGRYDRDQFQQWNQRGTVAGGVAYKFVMQEDLFVGFRVGGAATKEWGLEGPGQDDDVRPEGLLGLEAKWTVDRGTEIAVQSTYYPDLSDAGEYRVLSSAGISLRLDEKGTMSFRAGAEHEYDTHREDPFERTDVRYFALLILEF
jgi:putative salt-induced outer membrane protein YdiY